MFSGIAGRYDLLNHVLSLNIDKSWRRRVRQELQDLLTDPNAVVLDVACGTGDLSLELDRDAAARCHRHRFLPPDADPGKAKNG